MFYKFLFPLYIVYTFSIITPHTHAHTHTKTLKYVYLHHMSMPYNILRISLKEYFQPTYDIPSNRDKYREYKCIYSVVLYKFQKQQPQRDSTYVI